MIECVPNVSEGRDQDKIDQIVSVIKNSPQINFLDLHVDPDHNRSVITYAGSKESVLEAALALISKSIELIDINKHDGVHPYLGAVDVFPFVPLKNANMDDCVQLADDLGGFVWQKLKIPVYFYGSAARFSGRENLANVRRGGFIALQNEISLPKRKPDIGEPVLHPTAGAVSIGARDFLIAFNINLKSNDVELAKTIAKSIREQHGGLPGVRALGLYLKSRGLVQISMNIVDHKETSLKDVFDAVRKKSDEAGVEILESEIVGMLPRSAVFEEYKEYLKLKEFSENRILD